jgi:hypothetical protein
MPRLETIEKWFCDYCGDEYANEDDVRCCERGHFEDFELKVETMDIGGELPGPDGYWPRCISISYKGETRYYGYDDWDKEYLLSRLKSVGKP